MAIEVELKAWVEQVDTLRDKILKIAEPHGPFDKRDTYFSLPGQDASLFRIRREKEKNTVTYKEKELLDGIEVNQEHEFTVDDAEAFTDFSRYLGYGLFIEKHKQGTLYRWENVGIELSRVEGLGWFVEIEVLVARHEEVPKAREKLRHVLKELGITEEKIEPRYYNEMLKEKKTKT